MSAVIPDRARSRDRDRARPRLGPADKGRRMSFDEFIEHDFEDGQCYELGRGTIIVTDVPRLEHGEIVGRVTDLFVLHRAHRPGAIHYRAGGMECRVRAPGMQSDRHPDQAVYLGPPPSIRGRDVWTVWVPDLVVEVVSKGGRRRDYVEKAEECLRIGVREYWIVDPDKRLVLVHQRVGDLWEKRTVPVGKSYRTPLLPGLVVRPAELLGPGT